MILEEKVKNKIYLFFKRVFDLAVSVTLLTFLFPFLIFFSIAIRLTSKGPIFYRGIRTGLGGKKFKLIKFRTMVENAELVGGPSTGKNDPRVTRIGAFMRALKIDELPNLLNVLRGEMSLVGPRPEVPQYTDLYEGEEKLILDVRPGITDYSSLYFVQLDLVLGETDIDRTYETHVKPIKNKLRIKYAKEASFSTDLKILALTAWRLLVKPSPPKVKTDLHVTK